MKKKIILFDVDGVLTLPEEVFTVMYSKSRGLDPAPFELFFKNDWNEIVTGKRDLRDAINETPELWQWSGTADELLDYWFKSEDVRNQDLIDIIKQLKSKGTACFLATDQESHRGNYMKNIMFKDLFEDYFISSDIGYKKTDPEFFEKVLNTLKLKYGDIKPSDVIFFDDSQSKIDTAMSAGLDGFLYTGITALKQKLHDEGLL